MKPEQQLETLLSAVEVLVNMPAQKLQQNGILLQEIRNVFNAKNLTSMLDRMHRDYIAAKNAEYDRRPKNPFTAESIEFLHAYARFKGAAHNVYKNMDGVRTKLHEISTRPEGVAFNSRKSVAVRRAADKAAAATKEARAFRDVFNSIFSDHSLQIGTAMDPTIMGSYIDYSPYINNYQYYLSIPTLSQTIDRPIQIATREMPRIECEDEEFSELIGKVLKRSRFVERLQRLLLYSHLSPRGSLIVPIQETNGTIRFNVFNDTQFTYATGYQYTRLDYRDDGADGVTQIFALGNLLQNGQTCHFLCPGFEPIYAVGKNRLFQLKDAAEAVNIYLYTVKVLCIRAQILIQKWDGEGQNDTLLSRMRALTESINSSLSLSTAVQMPGEGASLDILTNNINEGFSKVSPIIKEYQGMLAGIMPDYFYGSDTAYSANSFNIHATHQNLRSEIQEGQIEPVYRYIINQYLTNDKRFAKWAHLEDDFDIEFESLYEPTDMEKADIEAKRINNIVTMAGYPELEQVFKDEGLLGADYKIASVQPPPDKIEDDLPGEKVLPLKPESAAAAPG